MAAKPGPNFHNTFTYVNFDLLIAPAATDYSARVVQSPAGEAAGEFVLPFSPQELGDFFWLSGHQLRKLTPISAASPDLEQTVPLDPLTFGARLFDAVFAGEIGTLFRRALDVAESQAQGLRIRLRIHNAPELADLPWEYLYSTGLDRFLALSHRTPLIRYIDLAQRTPALAVDPPLRILALPSDPADVEPLEVAREWSLLQNALQELQAQARVRLERLETPTLPALQQRLRQSEVHILHFMGHGYFDTDQDHGGLVFEDESGNSRRVNAEELATLVHDHRTLRLVVLNACEGARGGRNAQFVGVAQKLVQQGIPAVLAMQFAVTDPAALALAHEFYRALADGAPLETAVSEARKAVYLLGNQGQAQASARTRLEWGTPVLFSRSPDGTILGQSEAATDGARQNEENEGDMQDAAWWDRLPGDGTTISGIDTGTTEGDVIIANIGAGARNVAVGKQIVQQIYETIGEPTPDDKQIIKQQLAAVQHALAAATLDPAQAQISEFQLQLLEAELTKTDPEETPSANTIVQVGNWLLDNLPHVAEALAGLFATPAVGRVVGKAGETVVTWIKQRFGSPTKPD